VQVEYGRLRDLRDQSCCGRVCLLTSGICGEGPTPFRVVRDKCNEHGSGAGSGYLGLRYGGMNMNFLVRI